MKKCKQHIHGTTDIKTISLKKIKVPKQRWLVKEVHITLLLCIKKGLFPEAIIRKFNLSLSSIFTKDNELVCSYSNLARTRDYKTAGGGL